MQVEEAVTHHRQPDGVLEVILTTWEGLRGVERWACQHPDLDTRQLLGFRAEKHEIQGKTTAQIPYVIVSGAVAREADSLLGRRKVPKLTIGDASVNGVSVEASGTVCTSDFEERGRMYTKSPTGSETAIEQEFLCIFAATRQCQPLQS